jgi:hypothetical protein
LAAYGSSIPADGLKALGAEVHKYMAKRGNSWFMFIKAREDHVCQFSGLRVEFHPPSNNGEDANGLVECDRLNGYEWRGRLECRCAATRTCQDGKWGEWSDASTAWTMYLVKRNGKWQVDMHIPGPNIVSAEIGALPTSEWTIPKDSN